MPELPEVQTIVNELNGVILKKTIKSCEVRRPSVIIGPPELFIKAITGSLIQGVSRRGKYLIFTLDRGQLLVAHLKMTGKFTYAYRPSHTPYDRVLFEFESGDYLVFTDVRCFGKLEITNQKEKDFFFNKLGWEPWDKKLTERSLKHRLKKTSIPIKTALMNQLIIAGIGNIYASESLFDAGISPTRSANQLEESDLRKLIASIRKVLSLALKHNGTTISDFKRVDNKSGEFQNFLKVYGRTGQNCRLCGNKIEKIRQNQRSTFYCPHCQC